MSRVDVVWAESARTDLFDLIEPMRERAPKRALSLMSKLVSAIQRLSDYPESGRRFVEITEIGQIREIVVEQIRVFYCYYEPSAQVEIVAVFSARQNVSARLHSRLS